jgi:hypothetical protein
MSLTFEYDLHVEPSKEKIQGLLSIYVVITVILNSLVKVRISRQVNNKTCKLLTWLEKAVETLN